MGEVATEIFERTAKDTSTLMARGISLVPGVDVPDDHFLANAWMNPVVAGASALGFGGDVSVDPLVAVHIPKGAIPRAQARASETVTKYATRLPWNLESKIPPGPELEVGSYLAKRYNEYGTKEKPTILPQRGVHPLTRSETEYMNSVMQRNNMTVDELANHVAPAEDIVPPKIGPPQEEIQLPLPSVERDVDLYMRDLEEGAPPLLENLEKLDKRIRELPPGDPEVAARQSALNQVKGELRARFPGKILAREKATGKFYLADNQVKTSLSPERIADKYLRGPSVVEETSGSIVEAAGLVADGMETSVEKAARHLRKTVIPQENRIGGAVADAGLTGKMDPAVRGEKLLEHQVPGIPETAKPFFERGPVLLGRDVGVQGIRDPNRLLPGANTTSAALKSGEDIGAYGAFVGTTKFIFDDPRNPIAQGIYRTQRRARMRSRVFIDEIGKVFRPLENEIRKIRKPELREKFSRDFLRLVNAPPGKARTTAGKLLTDTQRQLADQTRDFFEGIIRKNPDKVQAAITSIAASRTTPRLRGHFKMLQGQIFDEYSKRGVLEQLGFILWRNEDFLSVGPDGVFRRAIPTELQEIDDLGKIDNLIHLFQHTYAGKDAISRRLPPDLVETFRATFGGIQRRMILEPAWRDMEKAVANLPPRMRQAGTDWIQNLRGVPSAASDAFFGRAQNARERMKYNFEVGFVDEAASALLETFYRGALFGNRSNFFANFFGQGFVNEAALEGPFAAFQGIARHYRKAFDGLPEEAFMGSFDALFGREIPRTKMGKALSLIPGIDAFRNFWEKAERQAGMTGSELINRSVGMHIGLKDALDRYNWRNRQANPAWTDVTMKELLTSDKVDPRVRDNLYFEALLHSERVNFVYGVDGSNPHIQRVFSRRATALTTQFLTYFGRQGEFLVDPIVKQRDPGIFINYLLLSGWLARLAGKAWGIDYSSSMIFGSIPRVREGMPVPAGPLPQLLVLGMRMVTEDDPEKAARFTKEFHRVLGLAVPGFVQLERDKSFIETLAYERLLTPGEWPKELIDLWGPTAAEQNYPFGKYGGHYPTDENLKRNLENILHSETPARAMGIPTLSSRMERRILTEIRRSNRTFRFEMHRIVDALIEEQQKHGENTERFQALVEEAGRMGIPFATAYQEGILTSVLPRVQRALLDSPKLTKAAYIDLVRDMYPEMWDDPEIPSVTLPYGKQEPSSGSYSPELLEMLEGAQ